MIHVQRIGLGLAVALAAVLAVRAGDAAVPEGTREDFFAESQYAVLVDTLADRRQVRPGEEFTLAARLIPYECPEYRFHVYGAEPSEDYSYVPSVFAMDEAQDVAWGEPQWPPGEEHDGQMWLPGQPVVTIAGRLAENAAAGERSFTGQLMFLACTENICLVPSQIDLSWMLEVVPADFAGQIAVLSLDELTAPVEVDPDRFSLPETPDVGGGLDLGATGGDGQATGGVLDLTRLQFKAPDQLSLWKILLLALLGGLVLNVMPCVLPVVSIKVIDLVKNVEKEPRSVVNHGLLFAGGIIFAFLVGAMVIAIIQAAGTQLGWGSQFQSPGFNIIMATIIFIFALSLLDVFKVKAPEVVAGGSEGLAAREGYSGSFFKGVLATVLGTPCVGPFLTPALYVAFSRQWYDTLMIFFVVGLGMAVPYLIMLPFITRMGRRERGQFSRRIQESKDWLEDFKRVMSFLLFGTAIYLLYILHGVLGGMAVIWTLFMLLGVGFAAWLYGRLLNLRKPGLYFAVPVGLLVALLTVWLTVPRIYACPPGSECGKIAVQQGMTGEVEQEVRRAWEEFSLELLQKYTSQGKTVLVDFTADWCPNCKTNEAVSLNIGPTMELKKELGIVFLLADWTARDEEIGRVLRALGSVSVPLTAIFPGSNPNSPILLDGVYTPGRLHEAMREAAGAV